VEFELKQIKELMAAMGRNGATRLELKLGDKELVVERATEESAQPAVAPPAPVAHFPVHHHPLPPSPHHPPHQPAGEAPAAAESSDSGLFVKAPMVGTMYYSPAPEEPAFVKVGDRIEEGTVVCIIEAMKVMNEVKAGVSGTVEEILVDNGQPVEFGTPLLRIRS